MAFLKRLKNIVDKSNNQLLALKDINRPAVKGRNGNDNDNDDDYKKIKAIEGKYKDEDNSDKNVDEEFNDMVRRSKNLEGKTYITGKNKSIYSNVFKTDYKKIIDDYVDEKIKEKDILDKLKEVNKGVKIYEENKGLYKNSPNIENQIINSKKYAEGLKKIIRLIDSNKIRIGKDLVQASTIAIPWIDDWQLYKQINEDVFAKYRKDKDSFELLSIKTFLDNINSSITKNKKDARKEFNTVRKNVQSESLKYIVKELEKSIFGKDEERTFAPSSATEPKKRLF